MKIFTVLPALFFSVSMFASQGQASCGQCADKCDSAKAEATATTASATSAAAEADHGHEHKHEHKSCTDCKACAEGKTTCAECKDCKHGKSCDHKAGKSCDHKAGKSCAHCDKKAGKSCGDCKSCEGKNCGKDCKCPECKERHSHSSTTAPTGATAAKTMASTTGGTAYELAITGMTCQACVNKLTGKLSAMTDIEKDSITVDLATKKAYIVVRKGAKTPADTLKQQIATSLTETGYTLTSFTTVQ